MRAGGTVAIWPTRDNRLVFHVFGTVAEFERNLIGEHTQVPSRGLLELRN